MSWEEMSWERKVRLVLLVCSGLFLLNALWLTILQRSDRSELHASPFYPVYLELRSLSLRPVSLLFFLIFIGYGLYGVFRRRKKSTAYDEFGRLALLALVTGTALGLILMLLFKL